MISIIKKTMLYFQNIKAYFYSLRPYIFFCSIIFIASIFLGYFTAYSYPNETQKIIDEIKEMWAPVHDATSLDLFIFIVFNNISKIAMMIAFGIIFGIFPIFFLFANGFIVGVFACVVAETISWQMFLVGVLPHGVIEIPALILGGAMGVKLGKVFSDRVFKKKEGVKKEFFLALEFFLKILIPLFILAAIIEAFITASLIKF